MSDHETFDNMDVLIQRVHQYETTDLLAEINLRAGRSPLSDLGDQELLRLCINLIAFSQSTPAARVEVLIATEMWERAFEGFDIEKVSALDPGQFYDEYWQKMGALRFPTKLKSMINCAKCFLKLGKEHSSFLSCLRSKNIPISIEDDEDIQNFWSQFDNLKKDFKLVEMPFFSQQTSLCHLLMMLGYDCAKPDSMVMSAAVDLGMVPSQPGTQNPNYSDSLRRRVVKTMQEYCVKRKLRMPVLDLYLLIQGGQSSVVHMVHPEFYRK